MTMPACRMGGHTSDTALTQAHHEEGKVSSPESRRERPMMSSQIDRVAEAAEVLAQAMVDEPLSRWLLPDRDEFLAVHYDLFVELIRLAFAEGRVDTWGDPIVGVAVWLRRPAVVPGRRSVPSLGGAGAFPAHAVERVERFAAVLRHLRERARPDEHAYLDTIAVLPESRRRGIGTGLLDMGHAWADGEGLPCALETDTSRNVAFYTRRGYAVVAELPLPGSGLTVTSMRRNAELRERRP
jgi:GNAT superfamily N-acetyltransferase